MIDTCTHGSSLAAAPLFSVSSQGPSRTLYELGSVGYRMGFQVVLVVKNPPVNAGDIRVRVQSLGQEDPLEEGMAPPHQ